LREKSEVSKIIFLFENQELNIKKIQQSIRIQKKNRLQYIEFLEKRVKALISENKNLKKYSEINNNMNNINNNEINSKTNIANISYYSNNKNYINSNNSNYLLDSNSSLYKTPNVTDRKSHLKKIELKKSNEYQNSIKYSPYINRYDENLNNVKNLNAQTALEQQYSSKQGGNNINVNINDDNSARRTNSFMNNLSNKRSNNSSVDKNFIKQNFVKPRY